MRAGYTTRSYIGLSLNESSDKDRAIKGLVVCYVLYYGYEVKDLESSLVLTFQSR